MENTLDMSAYDVFADPRKPPVVFLLVTEWPASASEDSFGARVLRIGAALESCVFRWKSLHESSWASAVPSGGSVGSQGPPNYSVNATGNFPR